MYNVNTLPEQTFVYIKKGEFVSKLKAMHSTFEIVLQIWTNQENNYIVIECEPLASKQSHWPLWTKSPLITIYQVFVFIPDFISPKYLLSSILQQLKVKFYPLNELSSIFQRLQRKLLYDIQHWLTRVFSLSIHSRPLHLSIVARKRHELFRHTSLNLYSIKPCGMVF